VERRSRLFRTPVAEFAAIWQVRPMVTCIRRENGVIEQVLHRWSSGGQSVCLSSHSDPVTEMLLTSKTVKAKGSFSWSRPGKRSLGRTIVVSKRRATCGSVALPY